MECRGTNCVGASTSSPELNVYCDFPAQINPVACSFAEIILTPDITLSSHCNVDRSKFDSTIFNLTRYSLKFLI